MANGKGFAMGAAVLREDFTAAGLPALAKGSGDAALTGSDCSLYGKRKVPTLT
jgi:hypothetical protein